MANSEPFVLVNDESTVLVTVFPGNTQTGARFTVATREDPSHVWGPPIKVQPDQYNVAKVIWLGVQ